MPVSEAVDHDLEVCRPMLRRAPARAGDLLLEDLWVDEVSLVSDLTARKSQLSLDRDEAVP